MLDNIKTPEQLLEWMSKNISYGFIDKNKKIYKHPTFDSFSDKYILQSPYDLYKSKVGVCWDQTLFEKFIFQNNIKLPFKIFYIEQINEMSGTHTFLIYKNNNQLYYFENSYEKYRGIHKFDSEEEVINYVINNMREEQSDNGYTITQIIDEPHYGCSCIEFMDFCLNQKFYKEGKMKRLMKRLSKSKCIFLGGTCAESTWRERLIPLLDISYFNPVVDDWNEEAQKKEIYEREHDDFCLYTITPLMEGVYSICEVTQDSNIRPEKTIFCLLKEDDGKSFTEGQWRSLEQVAKIVKQNGAQVFYNLEDIANYVNKKKD
jgi:hypothetical protein